MGSRESTSNCAKRAKQATCGRRLSITDFAHNTRVKRERLGATGLAAPDLAAEGGGAAGEDVLDGAPVRGRHRRPVHVEVVRREATEHVGELDHDRLRQRPVIRRSSSPCSEARVGVVRWV